MIKKVGLSKAVLLKIRVVTLFTLLTFFGVNKVFSQKGRVVPGIAKQQVQTSQKDDPTQILAEYNAVIDKYEIKSKKGRKDFNDKITEADRSTLETLYKKMSKKQQAELLVTFMPNTPPRSLVAPTNKQLEQWEDEKMYQIRVDGQKVANTILSNYSNTDFIGATVNKISTNSPEHGKYSYIVDLMTKDFYGQYYNQPSSKKSKTIMVVRTLEKDAAEKQ